MAYGYIQTAGNVATQLKKLNRDYEGRKTWAGLYGAVDLQKQQALGEIGYDYESKIAQAYATAYQQKSAIANSALGTGYKEQEQQNIDMALQEAFAAYKQNYLSSAATVEQNALYATNQIDTALQEEAQRYVDYEASAYSYLQNLYDRAYPGENADYDADATLAKLFAEDPNWSKYIVKETDDLGVETSRLMTEQELRARNYDLDASGQGTINKAGVDFYDQMLNAWSQEGSNYGFHSWLAEENPELYEWSMSTDSYNYNEAGTKIGTFKKMVGLQSTDDEYKFIERFGGMSEEEVKTTVQSFANDVSNIVNTGQHKDTKAALSAYSSALTGLTDYVDKLNLTAEQSKPILEAIASLQTTISSADIDNTSNWQAWSELINSVQDNWAAVQSDWSSGNHGGAALSLGNLALEGIFSFGTGLIMEMGHILFPKSVKALESAFGRNVYKDRATERTTSNKELVDNITQQYLDIMTLLASYAK